MKQSSFKLLKHFSLFVITGMIIFFDLYFSKQGTTAIMGKPGWSWALSAVIIFCLFVLSFAVHYLRERWWYLRWRRAFASFLLFVLILVFMTADITTTLWGFLGQNSLYDMCEINHKDFKTSQQHVCETTIQKDIDTVNQVKISLHTLKKDFEYDTYDEAKGLDGRAEGKGKIFHRLMESFKEIAQHHKNVTNKKDELKKLRASCLGAIKNSSSTYKVKKDSFPEKWYQCNHLKDFSENQSDLTENIKGLIKKSENIKKEVVSSQNYKRYCKILTQHEKQRKNEICTNLLTATSIQNKEDDKNIEKSREDNNISLLYAQKLWEGNPFRIGIAFLIYLFFMILAMRTGINPFFYSLMMQQSKKKLKIDLAELVKSKPKTSWPKIGNKLKQHMNAAERPLLIARTSSVKTNPEYQVLNILERNNWIVSNSIKTQSYVIVDGITHLRALIDADDFPLLNTLNLYTPLYIRELKEDEDDEEEIQGIHKSAREYCAVFENALIQKGIKLRKSPRAIIEYPLSSSGKTELLTAIETERAPLALALRMSIRLAFLLGQVGAIQTAVEIWHYDTDKVTFTWSGKAGKKNKNNPIKIKTKNLRDDKEKDTLPAVVLFTIGDLMIANTERILLDVDKKANCYIFSTPKQMDEDNLDYSLIAKEMVKKLKTKKHVKTASGISLAIAGPEALAFFLGTYLAHEKFTILELDSNSGGYVTYK